ncbi:ABC transporter ATP-binding protein [Parafrankia elaeagni]|uniref:ABC transporter ATP-binding protein n=1 Tax=Parafrankia elaeagni TaxID=222534 RepID=UPI00054F408F
MRIRGAVRGFGSVRALDGLDLDVPAGSLMAVLGPSGCGKTTLLRAVAGFERLDAGEISVLGRTVAGRGVHLPPHHRHAVVVPQEGALFPHLDVARNVGFGLDHAARRSSRISEVLALVGLEGFEHRMPHQLSGGQQQRVAIARALAPRPALVLLDEPFTALDAGLRAVLRREVRAALLADGTTAILVTHDQDEALGMADLVAVQRAGRIVQVGPPHQVYTRPADPWVAGFVGEAALVRGWWDGDQVRTPLGTVPVAAADAAATGITAPGPGTCGGRPARVTVLVRPEQVAVTAAPTDLRTGRPSTTDPGSDPGSDPDLADATRIGPGRVARVVAREFRGHEVLVTLDFQDDGGSPAQLRARTGVATDQPAFEVGDQVLATLRSTARLWPDPSP